LISSSSTVADAAADAASTAASSFAAAQPLEPLAQLLNPFVLGSSIWELGHSMTGLPWWASIPATTLAMRFALLPLTLKAKSAALNWVLLQNSFQTANNLLDSIKQQQQQGTAAGGSSDKPQQASNSLAGQQQQASVEQLKRPSKLKLVRSYYRYFRKQQKTTSLWWWLANAAVQVSPWRSLLASELAWRTELLWLHACNSRSSWHCSQGLSGSTTNLHHYQREICCLRTVVLLHRGCLVLQANTFVIMSVALRQMADARWPGMADQGAFWFTDLTQPSVLLSSPIWASPCPYGVAGTLLPVALLFVYLRTVQQSPGGAQGCVRQGVHPVVLCEAGSCRKGLNARRACARQAYTAVTYMMLTCRNCRVADLSLQLCALRR
jgi:hypothetical protein